MFSKILWFVWVLFIFLHSGCASVHYTASTENISPFIHNRAAAEAKPDNPSERLSNLQIIEENTIYHHIIDTDKEVSIQAFDAYLSLFPQGHHSKAIKSLFQKRIKKDYIQMGDKPSSKSLSEFIQTYGNIGRNYYVINASTLNIRNLPNEDARQVGVYNRAQTVYAFKTQAQWLQTDLGWIKRASVKPVLKNIPLAQAYVQKALKRIKKNSRPVSKPFADLSPAPAETLQNVQKELNILASQPKMPELEAFILKYKDNYIYEDIIRQARNIYKSLLLGDIK